MAVITLAANSTTLVLNGFIFNDFLEGDYITLETDNDLASHVVSSDGGAIIKERIDGGVSLLTMRLPKFSDSDIFINSIINSDGITLLNGSMKENFTKDEVEGVESFILENGYVVKKPGSTKNNQDPNGLVECQVRFINSQRNL